MGSFSLYVSKVAISIPFVAKAVKIFITNAALLCESNAAQGI